MKTDEQNRHGTGSELVFTVTANFTAEPVAEFLRYWIVRLGLGPARLEFSGYNQVFQELMAPGSLLASREPGANFILIRLEDWARERKQGSRTEAITVASREFIAAFGSLAQRSGRPSVVVVCPHSQEAASDPGLSELLNSLDREVADAVAALPGVRLITAEDVQALYPVRVIDDPESNRQGHIPFTRAYWAALGTVLLRMARSPFQAPHKVIVVDADNTLWGGVVGEVGASQVQLGDQRIALQQFLLVRKKQGMLLALASKNREEDVAEVFRRPDMVLRREDFVAWKVNWEPKSRNVAALAKELDLGPDSFIFLDDNPVEIADVAANCPSVTTLLLPSDSTQIPHFLQHVWAFDLAAATATDEKRTEMYRQQSERVQFQDAAATFREFIEGLGLEVSVAAPSATEYERAAQLTQRTNQFNTSGVRRTAAELSSLLGSNERSALLVGARDRFGDYGQVGFASFFADSGRLNVDSFLMSCRVLGKGVEHQVLAALGGEAQQRGLSEIVIPFKATNRNQPAENFLKSVCGSAGPDGAFRLSAAAAATVVFDPESSARTESTSERLESNSSGRTQLDFLAIATELDSVDKVLYVSSRHFRRERPQLQNELIRPRNLHEAKLARIWEEVLHIDPVGVTDSFLSLGGQSLQAASIVSRIAEENGVRLPLSVIFSSPTIAELAVLAGTGQDAAVAVLPKAKDAQLSSAQERLWFLDQFIPNRAAYNIPMARRVRGKLNLEALKSALGQVMLRHQTLRSRFAAGESSNPLTISETASVSLRHVLAKSDAEAFAVANEEARQTFELSEGRLLRCLVISLGLDDHLIVLNVHHIVADGWSMGILLRDLTEAYGAFEAGREPLWMPLPASYQDYAAWQRARLPKGEFNADLNYWKNELRGAPSLLELPTDKPRPSVMSYAGQSATGKISSAARLALESLAKREGCTPFMVLLAAWQSFLQRYSQQDDIVVGVPVAGRNHPALEELVGCFVNTLAIRTRLKRDRSFLELLHVVRGKVLDALAHQDLPFEHLVGELGLERDLSRSPLFQVMLVLQNPNGEFSPAGTSVSSERLHNGGAKFDLVLEATPTSDAFDLALEFNTSLFLPETAKQMLRHFTRLLEQACAVPETPLASLSMMDEGEVAQVLSFVNPKHAAVKGVECLHHWFERQAAATPDGPAVSCEGKVLSYGQLNRRANRVAHHLVSCGVGPDVLVGICMDRTLDLIVAVLGVLKAGGAYLPIDLSYPADRLTFMLEDAQASVLLTEKKLLSSLPKHRAHTICLDDVEEILAAQPEGNPVTAVQPDHMAYVIYTSGSTGKPKGCMVTHRNVARLMRSTEQWYGFDQRDVWTLFHSSAFDFSVWEIWGALLYGGRLVVVPFMVSRSPEAFYELLSKEQVTVLNQTPSAFRQLIQAEESVGQKPLALRYVIFGGEALEMQSLRPWFERHGDQMPRLVNMYGITETTVHVTYRALSKDDLDSGSVIGVPIPDLQIYILDSQQQPVPIGVPGEMFVGGAGLARGYLRRPELTEQRFIPDHLSGKENSRLYKTGDLARFLPGRDIEYLGRIDDQVKIRGFRIELGEIESVLCQHPAVREAAVMAREDVPGTKRLAAYLVTSQPAPDVGALREHLKQKLPEYMVPAAFMFLEKLPLTNNGKIDRKALPVPEQQRPELSGRYVAPRTAVEKTLAAIWSKVLRVPQVGINDNFFELGGDSILSIQIISSARREGLQLTPKLLFANQTIASLAGVAQVADEKPVTQEAVSGEVPLTPVQHWFFEQNLEEPEHYNQAVMLEVTGTMDRSVLESALRKVGQQHDALRLRYVRGPQGWKQTYSSRESVSLDWINLADVAVAEQSRSLETVAASAEASLNLERGPLCSVTYCDLGTGRAGRLLIVVHHLAVDGISWRPLLEDIETAYLQIKAGRPVALPSKTTSFKKWAERLHQLAGSDSLQRELPYWKEVTTSRRGQDSSKQLVADSSSNTEGSASTVKLSLTADETQALLQQVPAIYNTQINDVLLTALTRAWTEWSGSRELFTNLEGHGRENLFEDADLSRTVGWFTSIFPVRLELQETQGRWQSGEALKSIKEQLRQIPQRGIGYGILRYLNNNSNLVDGAQPAMVFNYLGQFDQVVAGSKLFRLAAESTGPWHSPEQRRRHALEINCMVVGGQLEFSWTYNSGAPGDSSVSRLAAKFLAALKEIIAHCQSPAAGGRTPSDFPLAGLEQTALDQLVAGRRDIEDIYPLSPIQTLFYSANPGALQSAFDQWQCTLRGELNLPAFQRAWLETLRRHSILRSTIHGESVREPVQVVHRDVRLPWRIEDWSESPSAQQAERWTSFLKEDRAQPLNLTEAPAMRFALVRLDSTTWKFLWSVPALLLDGWSWPVVFRDASRLYESFSHGQDANLDAVRPYRDYLEWLRRQSGGEAEAYWRENLAEFREPTQLPGESPEHDGTGERYVEHVVHLSAETTTALKSAARGMQLTLSTLVQGAWALLLKRQSGGTDVLFGAAFAGRPADLSGVESIVGPFVNNLPVRVAVNPELATGDFLQQLHSRLLELNSFQYIPLMEIQSVSEVPWRHRLFDSLVVFQNYLVDDSAKSFGRRINIEDFAGPVHTNYPIMLLAEPGDRLRLTLIYDRESVSRKAIERWGRDLAVLLERVPRFSEKPVSELLELLSHPVASGAKTRKKLRAQSQNFVAPQTEMEQTIADVWKTMFGVEQVSVDENFFDLGGHSLLLVQMHGRLRETLKTEFPIVTLFEYPTVRALAGHLDQPVTAVAKIDERWQQRAQRQKQALAHLKVTLKK